LNIITYHMKIDHNSKKAIMEYSINININQI